MVPDLRRPARDLAGAECRMITIWMCWCGTDDEGWLALHLDDHPAHRERETPRAVARVREQHAEGRSNLLAHAASGNLVHSVRRVLC